MNHGNRETEEYFTKRLAVYISVTIVAFSGGMCFFPALFTGLTPVLPEYRSLISWSLTAVIIALSIFSLKKRGVIMAFGKLSTWYNIHFLLGLAVVVLLPLHTGFFSGSGISWAMTLTTFFIALNGIYGFAVHVFMPHTVLNLQLRNDTFKNLKSRERGLVQNVKSLLIEKSPAYTEVYRQIVRRRENSLFRLFTTIFSKECVIPDNIPPLSLLLAEIPDKERRDYAKLTGYTNELFNLKDQIRIITFLNRWLIYHISAVTILLLLLLMHITSFYYY